MSVEIALRAYLRAAAQGADHARAAVFAVEAVAGEPWEAAAVATLLRGARQRRALDDLGLTAALRERAVRGVGVVAAVPRGAPYPSPVAGAPWEPSRDFAMRVADAARSVARRRVRRACDLACGVGGFLLAMEAWGVTELVGVGDDPLALSLARVVVPRATLVTGTLEEFDVVLARGRALAGAVERVAVGGGMGAVVPERALVDARHAPLRRSWVSRHAVRGLTGPERPNGAVEPFWVLAIESGGGPAPVLGKPAAEVLATPYVPIRVA